MRWEDASYIATTLGLPAVLIALGATAHQISAASKAYCLQWIFQYLAERRSLEEKFADAVANEDEGRQSHRLIEFLNFLEGTCMAYNLDLIPSRTRPVIHRDLCHTFATLQDSHFWSEVRRQHRIEGIFEHTQSFLKVNRVQIDRCSEQYNRSLEEAS